LQHSINRGRAIESARAYHVITSPDCQESRDLQAYRAHRDAPKAKRRAPAPAQALTPFQIARECFGYADESDIPPDDAQVCITPALLRVLANCSTEAKGNIGAGMAYSVTRTSDEAIAPPNARSMFAEPSHVVVGAQEAIPADTLGDPRRYLSEVDARNAIEAKGREVDEMHGLAKGRSYREHAFAQLLKDNAPAFAWRRAAYHEARRCGNDVEASTMIEQAIAQVPRDQWVRSELADAIVADTLASVMREISQAVEAGQIFPAIHQAWRGDVMRQRHLDATAHAHGRHTPGRIASRAVGPGAAITRTSIRCSDLRDWLDLHHPEVFG